MKDWLKVIGVVVGACVVSFLIISGIVWVVLWTLPVLGFTVPPFSWKLCLLVFVVIIVIQNIFKIESPIKVKISKTE